MGRAERTGQPGRVAWSGRRIAASSRIAATGAADHRTRVLFRHRGVIVGPRAGKSMLVSIAGRCPKINVAGGFDLLGHPG
jgi:hypothetical protein